MLASGALPNVSPQRHVFCVLVEYRLKAQMISPLINMNLVGIRIIIINRQIITQEATLKPDMHGGNGLGCIHLLSHR